LRKPSSSKVKPPPYTHREIARAIFNYESNKYFLSTWLKVEAYTLFFTALPHLITLAIWALIAAAFYWAVTLI
jgi:hypothetical protein